MERDYVRMAEYLAAGRPQQEILLPEVPALYVWQLDYMGPTQASAARRLNASFPGERRSFEAAVGPYARVNVSDHVAPLGAGKAAALEAPTDRLLHRWMQDLATQLQRPLYVGITGNLLARVRQHVDPGSRLNQYLIEARVRLEHCGLTYFPVPLDVAVEEDVRGQVEDQLDSDEEGDYEDEDPVAGSTGAPSAPAVEIIQALRLTEALVIRLAQPYLNRKLE